MSKPLGVSQTLELLDRLRRTLSDFALREKTLNGTFGAQTAARAKARETAIASLRRRLDADTTSAEAAFQAQKTRCLARFERRRAGITKARKSLEKKTHESVDEQEGRKKYRLQRSAIEAERQRDTDLAAATAALEEFQQALAATREQCVTLEARAARAFGGYAAFRRWLAPDQTISGLDLSPDEQGLRHQLHTLHDQTQEALGRFERLLLPRLFSHLSVWIVVLALGAVCAGLTPVLQRQGLASFTWTHAGAAFGALLLITWAAYFQGKRGAGPAAREITTNLVKARHWHDACLAKSTARRQQAEERIKHVFAETTGQYDQEWKQAVSEAAEQRERLPRQVEEKAARLLTRAEAAQRVKLAGIERSHAETLARLQQEADARIRQIETAHAAKIGQLRADHEHHWRALEVQWKAAVQPLDDAFHAANATDAALFPDWQSPAWAEWTPPVEFRNAAPFGRLEVDVARYAEAMPTDARLALPGAATFRVPLMLTFPVEGSILFETGKTGGDEAVRAINSILFRLLSATPPGKVSFTILDPVGLGQNFAGLMHLADFEDSHIHSRIWTQSGQIEERLAELSEHMEKVIQMYLRNEYATIAEYNAQAGTIAEKYHFLVVAGFPVNFTDTAVRRLLNIAASGARCGVYTLIVWDQRHAAPADFVPDELRKSSVCLVTQEHGFALARRKEPGLHLVLDEPPPPEFVTEFLHRVGQHSKDSNRVEVPFEQVAPSDAELWTGDTTDELVVPVGRSGATKLQNLAIGKGTRQHALIAGKTGSGKSTLFHVIITNLALWCSPEQVEFYLVDFKKGVEFKCYATRRLPHARVVAIESDREFGLSVLQRVDEELRRRGDLFRKLGAQDLAGYRRAGGSESLPRTLLIIDEFQEFFTEEDRVSQGAAVLLDRIVRQGRAFGIHALLGSQTLGGAYTLARATLGQMVIRVALQCNEADAYLIMDENNAAPRLLSRPGEGIYNDAAGSLEGNSPFQVVWLPDETRDTFLAKVRERADRQPKAYPGPIVFEGNAPADVAENHALSAVLEALPARAPAASRAWLGAPNSIKGPTEVVFERQSGSNLLLVGQREEAALVLVSLTVLSLAAQYPPGTVQFVLLDSTPPGSPEREYLESVVKAIPQGVVLARGAELSETFGRLAAEAKRRSGEETAAEAPAVFLLVHGMQNFKKLRQEDEFSFSASDSGAGANPAGLLKELLTEGPTRGLHVVATVDTYNNVTRFLGRKLLTEFEMRVLFQMSAADSASLIDSPAASTLGLHRALYYNDREGFTETFRPYARPGGAWLEQAARHLARRRAGGE